MQMQNIEGYPNMLRCFAVSGRVWSTDLCVSCKSVPVSKKVFPLIEKRFIFPFPANGNTNTRAGTKRAKHTPHQITFKNIMQKAAEAKSLMPTRFQAL